MTFLHVNMEFPEGNMHLQGGKVIFPQGNMTFQG